MCQVRLQTLRQGFSNFLCVRVAQEGRQIPLPPICTLCSDPMGGAGRASFIYFLK